MSTDTCYTTTADDVILSSNIINLDKNCIKYREKSYKKFLTRPLSVPSNLNLNLAKRLASVLRQTSHEQQQQVAVRPISLTPSGLTNRLDLDFIKKLEEEIYEKREMVYLNYDANKTAGSSSEIKKNITLNRSQIYPHITTTTTAETKKPVLYLDAENFEPILLRNNDGQRNHSMVIIDNSQYYPILMRCDEYEGHHHHHHDDHPPKSKNTETVVAENGPTTSSSTSIKFKRFLFNRNSFSFRFKNKRRRKQQQQQQHQPQDDHEAEIVVPRSNSDTSIAHASFHWGNEGNTIVKRIPVCQAFSEPDLNEKTESTTLTATLTTSSFVKSSSSKKRNNTTHNKYVAKNANNVMLRHSIGPSTSAVKTWIYRRR